MKFLGRWTTVCLINLVVLFALLLVLEGVFRLAGRTVYEHRSLYMVSDVPGLLYENLPGYSGRYAHAPVHINSRGLRGPEFEIEKREGVRRIIVLGDSFAFGHGVKDNETFPAQLHDLLNKGPGRPGFEVLNAGVNGYNTRQELIWLLHRGAPLEPDLVILTFFHNDLGNRFEFILKDGALASRHHPGSVPMPGFIKTFLRENSVLYWIVAERLAFIRARLDARPGIKSADHSFSTMDPEGWEVCKEAMKRLHHACRTRGVQTLFLIHPELSPPSSFRQRAAHEEFARFCEREGIAY
ncbi:MAG: SGNH/GDSL hydrolase family protein, partial [Desulfobacterales bacterium]|nr:SGNH/GDSL hydrolase family protein [Desulfobacterales bacterium]